MGCVYRPPKTSYLDDTYLVSALSTLNEDTSNLVIAGDFNFPDIHWPLNKPIDTKNGTSLFVDFLLNSNLTQLVSGPTRFRIGCTPSTLDLVLTNDKQLISNLTISAPIGKSDHATVEFQVQVLHQNKPKHIRKSISRINLANLKHYFATLDWSDVLDDNNPCSSWCKFHSLITNAVKRNTFMVNLKINCRKPWITSTLIQRSKQKRKLWNNFKKSGSLKDFKLHRTFSNKLISDTKMAKTKYENKLLESGPKAVYRYVRQKVSSTVSSPVVRNEDGILSENNLESAETLLKFFHSIYVNEPNNNIPLVKTPRCAKSLAQINFTENALLDEILSANSNSSPGPDNISMFILKNCANEILKPLLHVMQISFNSSCLPSDWLIASVIPIFKKGDKTLASNYRPISLTSTCCKLMEKIICKQLLSSSLSSGTLPQTQHGFLPNRSVITCLLSCLNTWTSHIDRSDPVDVVYLDFEKAFDRVPHRRLLSKLDHLGIRGKLLNWIAAFLSNRTFFVKVGNSRSTVRSVMSGVPQGSVLGPILFSLYISDLSFLIKSEHVFYADDCKIFGRSFVEHSKVQKDLNIINDWCDDWLIPINRDKCNILRLGRKNPNFPYYIGNQCISSKDCQKDLGVIITKDLSWSVQVASIVKRANSLSYILFKAFSRPSSQIFSKLYKTYVLPILEFASVIWSPWLIRDKDNLEKVQRRLTKKVTGFKRLSYRNRLDRLNFQKLEFRRRRNDLIWSHKLIHDNTNICEKLFKFNKNKQLRGHKLKLNKDKFRISCREYFFSNRVCEDWNRLPEEIVDTASKEVFKNKLDLYIEEFLS